MVERGLIRRRVNCEKQISLFHVGAVLKVAGENFPTDLGLNLHRLVSRAGPDFIKINRNIFADYFRDEDWPHR